MAAKHHRFIVKEIATWGSDGCVLVAIWPGSNQKAAALQINSNHQQWGGI